MHYTPAPRDPKADPIRINLLSDTQTRPTPAMREAMARAEVGDEQIGDDPTVNLLCERVADLLGKEAAVFMPSGTMCNIAATLAHCRPGDEILAHVSAHIIAREGGAHAALGGFQITPLPGDDGQFAPETFRAALHPRSRYQPPQTVVSVEQTANIGGGTIWKKTALDEVVAIAKANGLITHMDGARLLNACVATKISARDMAAGWDSAWIDFSKGLGAPIGGVIAGSRQFIDDVWRWKQRLGGSMRQAGMLRPPASTRSTITSTASPTIMPMRGRWRAGWRRSTASRCRRPRPIWCSSGPTAPASPATKWSKPCASAASCSR